MQMAQTQVMQIDSPGHLVISFFRFILHLTVWGVEPVVTHQTSWLESTGGQCTTLP